MERQALCSVPRILMMMQHRQHRHEMAPQALVSRQCLKIASRTKSARSLSRLMQTQIQRLVNTG